MPALSRLLDVVFPPQCLSCHAIVAQAGNLCLPCWQNIHFITEPYCAACGLPFEYSIGEGALCGVCLHAAPSFARARSAFTYDDASRALVLQLKYADQTHLAATYGVWLARFGSELIAGSDLIVPVPLHWRRFVSRRYNQAALLAYALRRQCGLPVLPDALLRTRPTAPQSGLTRKQRQKNVRGALRANPRHAAVVRGKNILLIDDVMTTMATVEQCAKALRKAGATQVNVLTLARKT